MTDLRGEVYVAGVRLNDLSDDQLAEFRNKNIGFVFQLYYLIPRMSILENVELPLVLRGCRGRGVERWR